MAKAPRTGNRPTSYDAEAVQALAMRMTGLLDAIGALGMEAAALVETLQRVQCLSMEDQWARSWGETVNMADAARMLGIGYTKIREFVAEGILPTTPDGRVRVRDACKWAYSQQERKIPKVKQGRPIKSEKPVKPVPSKRASLPEHMRFKR